MPQTNDVLVDALAQRGLPATFRQTPNGSYSVHDGPYGYLFGMGDRPARVDWQIPGSGPLPTGAAAEKQDDNAWERLSRAGLGGLRRGWNPDDPIGLDPATIRRMREQGLFYNRDSPFPGGLVEMVNRPFWGIADLLLQRVPRAAVHGVAALTGQAAEELGASSGMASRLEGDLIGMAEMGLGKAGGLPAHAARLRTAATIMGRNALPRRASGSTPPASAYTGRKRLQLKNRPKGLTRNRQAVVGGRPYTGHALDAMQNRGITPRVVEDAISRGQAYHNPRSGRTMIHDPENDISIVLSNKKVITVRFGDANEVK